MGNDQASLRSSGGVDHGVGNGKRVLFVGVNKRLTAQTLTTLKSNLQSSSVGEKFSNKWISAQKGSHSENSASNPRIRAESADLLAARDGSSSSSSFQVESLRFQKMEFTFWRFSNKSTLRTMLWRAEAVIYVLPDLASLSQEKQRTCQQHLENMLQESELREVPFLIFHVVDSEGVDVPSRGENFFSGASSTLSSIQSFCSKLHERTHVLNVNPTSASALKDGMEWLRDQLKK